MRLGRNPILEMRTTESRKKKWAELCPKYIGFKRHQGSGKSGGRDEIGTDSDFGSADDRGPERKMGIRLPLIYWIYNIHLEKQVTLIKILVSGIPLMS